MDCRTHERGVGMLNTPYVEKDTIKNFSPVPNAVFDLGLHHMEINIYAYLLRIEDRRTYQCIVSYPAIARKLGISVNTVAKYVAALEEHGLIRTERTEIITGTVSSATAVSSTPSCRSRMLSPSAMSVSWRKRDKPWNGSGHRQEPKSWALRSLRQRESRARKTAKYALLTRGRTEFWEHAARSEGSDTTPVSLMRNLLLFDTGAKGEQSAWVHRFSPGYGEFR